MVVLAVDTFLIVVLLLPEFKNLAWGNGRLNIGKFRTLRPTAGGWDMIPAVTIPTTTSIIHSTVADSLAASAATMSFGLREETESVLVLTASSLVLHR